MSSAPPLGLRAAILSNAGSVAGACSASTGLVAFMRHMVARTAFWRESTSGQLALTAALLSAATVTSSAFVGVRSMAPTSKISNRLCPGKQQLVMVAPTLRAIQNDRSAGPLPAPRPSKKKTPAFGLGSKALAS